MPSALESFTHTCLSIVNKKNITYKSRSNIGQISLRQLTWMTKCCVHPLPNRPCTDLLGQCLILGQHTPYTDHAGLEIPVNSCIASPFSRQIANVNAGPVLALESIGAKQSFHCNSLNIGLMYKQ